MKIIVKKFGGTSLSDIDRINRAISYIVKTKSAGYKVVIVVSAMGKETDRLLTLTDNLEEYRESDDLSALLSAGEQISSSIFSIMLHKQKVKGQSFQGWQVPILTNSGPNNAYIESIDTKQIIKSLKLGMTPIVSGFQGINKANRITTLGRGGSDTTAVALAAKLNAVRCDIYTDVDGVYTTDPNIDQNAKKIPKMSYEEMLEMASTGSKVLHTRSVELAMKNNLTLQVLSSLTKETGTFIVDEKELIEKEIVSGVSYSKNEAKVTISGILDKPGISAKIFSLMTENNINVDMIVQNISQDGISANITFTISQKDFDITKSVIEKNHNSLKYKSLSLDKNVAKISVIGMGMMSQAGVAEKMFKTLAKNEINILAISTSEIKISVLIEEKHTNIAVKSLHEAYNL